MHTKRPIKVLFTTSGCLTQKAILAYLEGGMTSRDQKSVNDHLGSCVFCREAVEGLSGVKSTKVVDRVVSALNKHILQQATSTSSPRYQPVIKKIPVFKNWAYVAAVASIVLFIGFLFMMHQVRKDRNTVQLATVTDTSRNVNYSREQEAEHQSYESAQSPVEPAMPVKKQDSGVPPVIQPVSAPSVKTADSIIPSHEMAAVEADKIIPDSSNGRIEPYETVLMDMEIAPVPEPSQGMDSGVAGETVTEVGGVAIMEENSSLRSVAAGKASQGQEEIFVTVEQMPEFPGGNDSLDAFIRRNLHYPAEALARKIEGKVYVSFVVNRQGAVTNATILRGIGYGCNEEALRLVNAMPAWNPGKQRGSPVSVQYNLPIPFKVPD